MLLVEKYFIEMFFAKYYANLFRCFFSYDKDKLLI